MISEEAKRLTSRAEVGVWRTAEECVDAVEYGVCRTEARRLVDGLGVRGMISLLGQRPVILGRAEM